MTRLILPDYTEAQFTNRTNEVKEFWHALDGVRRTDEQPPQLLAFRGGRGTGKTWLARHLNHLASNEPNTKSFLITIQTHGTAKAFNCANNSVYDFAQNAGLVSGEESLSPDTDFALMEISKVIRHMTQHLDTSFSEATILEDKVGILVRGVQRWLAGSDIRNGRNVFVLIVDSIFEAESNVREQLETHILAPFANMPGVLLVLTGRGAVPRFRSAYLKIDPKRITDLVAFGGQPEDTSNSSDIRKQIELAGLNPSLTPVVTLLGGGFPLNTYYLASRLSGHPDLTVIADVLDQLANELFGFEKPLEPEQKRLRGYFEALCILDQFRVPQIETLVKAYFENDEYLSINPVLGIRNEMTRTHLFSWDSDAKAFKIQDAVRTVLMAYLALRNEEEPKTWDRLHDAAIKLYKEYADEFVKYAAEFNENHHQLSVQRRKYDDLEELIEDALAEVTEPIDARRTTSLLTPISKIS